jgi:long-chain acyl-CoA synthetase
MRHLRVAGNLMNITPLDLAAVHTLPELLAFRVAHSPQGEAYREFDAAAGRWLSTTWAEAGTRIARWGRALAAMQLPAHASVAILLPNGLNAVSIDQAALSLGMVPVPLHAIDNAGSIAYILADCEASVLVVSSLSQWRAIQAVGTPLPALRCVVVIAPESPLDAAGGLPRLVSLADWLAGGDAYTGVLTAPAEDDLAALVYTSGTTGKPKGVMLTHRNVMSNVRSIVSLVAPLPEDVFLSFLPLSHTFERTAGYYLPIAAGSCVAYARSVALLAEDLKTVRPTMLISVPRIYERVFAKLQETLAPSPFKTRLFLACAGGGLAAVLPDAAPAADGCRKKPVGLAGPGGSRFSSGWWAGCCWRSSAAACAWP